MEKDKTREVDRPDHGDPAKEVRLCFRAVNGELLLIIFTPGPNRIRFAFFKWSSRQHCGRQLQKA